MDVDYSCYEGRSVTGASDVVMSRGAVVVRDGVFSGSQGPGQVPAPLTVRVRPGELAPRGAPDLHVGDVVGLAVRGRRGLVVHRDCPLAEQADGMPAAIREVEDDEDGLRAEAPIRAMSKGRLAAILRGDRGPDDLGMGALGVEAAVAVATAAWQ